MAVIAVLAGLLLTSNGYLLYVRPQHRRAPLLAALPLLGSELRQDLAAAETLLVEALSAGLGRADARDARFALAWARAKLGRFDPAKYGDALAVLAIPEPPGGGDPATADLRLWLLAQTGKHDEILAAIARQPDLADRPVVRPLYAAALEHRAVDLWNRLDVDGAVEHLDRARTVQPDRQIRARELVDLLIQHGMRAVGDEAFDAAEKSFTDAGERAADGSAQSIEARLGQLVCRWRRGDRRDMAATLRTEFEALQKRARDRGPDRDDVRLLRAHLGWWYLVAMLEDWLRTLPPGQWLPPTERERFLAAVRGVQDADPELGAVVMMHGMLDYGLATDQQQIASAVATLERSTRVAKGVVLPAVSEIIGRARRGPASRTGPAPRPTADWDTAERPVPGTAADHTYPVPEEPPPTADGSLAELIEQLSFATDDPALKAVLDQAIQIMRSRHDGPRREDGRV